jgi:hypothetical protein
LGERKEKNGWGAANGARACPASIPSPRIAQAPQHDSSKKKSPHTPRPPTPPSSSVSRALRALGAALRLALGAGKRPPTPAAAFEGYGKVVVAVDDLAYEGVLDVTGREGAARAARLRGEA